MPRTVPVLAAAVSLLWLIGVPCPMAAQTAQTGMLEGRITLVNGRVIANAVVTVQQADGSFGRTTRTDDLGEFRLSFLVPGSYTVLVRLVGFTDVTIEAVLVRATAVERLVITLEPARTALEPVTVRAAPPSDRRRTSPEVTRSLQARERELLPAARNANALIGLLPGIRPGQVYGGSTGQANLYQLDGVSVNQPGRGGSFLLPNVDWIEELRVIGPGAGAEYGNFQGGLINIVTKSGSNTMQGQLRTFVEHRSLNATNVNALETGRELAGRIEVSGELRGPIIHNRLYYFVSGQEAHAEDRLVDVPNSVVDAVHWLPVRTARREQTYYGKLTLQASDQDIVNVSLGIDQLTRERVGLSAFRNADASSRGVSPSLFYQANWQHTVDNRSAFEIKVSGYSGRDDELPYHGPTVPSVQLLDAANTPQFVNATYTQRNTPASHGISAHWNRFVTTGPLQHHMKVGGEHLLGVWREQRSRNGGLSWYTEAGGNFDPSSPVTWQAIPSLGVYATADTGGRIDLNAETRNSAMFLQDDIRLSDRLSLSAGVRLSHWAGLITPGHGGSGSGRERFSAISARAIDPRIGATVDVFGAGHLLARAHWGRYHQHLFALFFDRAPGANVFTSIGYCDWNDTDRTVLPELARSYSSSAFGTLFTCFPGVNLANEAKTIANYRQPYVDQVTFSLEQSIGSHLTLEALYLNRRNHAVLSLVDRNLARNWSPVRDVRIANAQGALRDVDGRDLVLPVVYVRSDDLRERLRAGDRVPGYSALDTVTLAFAPDLVLQPVQEASRAFRQLQLSLAGTYPRVSFNAALSYTSLTGNVFSVNGYAQPNGEGSGPFAEPNARINFMGNLENFAPWDVMVRTTGQLPWGLEGGAFLTYSAGEFWTPTLILSRQLSYTAAATASSAVPLDARLFRNANGQAVYTEARGRRQLPSRATLDLRLQKGLALRRHDMLVGVEVFNLFNTRAITSVNDRMNGQDASDPSSLVGAVRLRQMPTTLRINLQYRL